MANVRATTAVAFQVDIDKLSIGVPLPDSLECYHCGSKYSSKTRAANALNHIRTKHNKRTDCVLVYHCGACMEEFVDLKSAHRHFRYQCLLRSETDEDHLAGPCSFDQDPQDVTAGTLTLQWRPRPSRCPLCAWVSHAEAGTDVAKSVHHHLARVHGKIGRINVRWKCTECPEDLEAMKGHTARDHRCRGDSGLGPNNHINISLRANEDHRDTSLGSADPIRALQARSPRRSARSGLNDSPISSALDPPLSQRRPSLGLSSLAETPRVFLHSPSLLAIEASNQSARPRRVSEVLDAEWFAINRLSREVNSSYEEFPVRANEMGGLNRLSGLPDRDLQQHHVAIIEPDVTSSQQEVTSHGPIYPSNNVPYDTAEANVTNTNVPINNDVVSETNVNSILVQNNNNHEVASEEVNDAPDANITSPPNSFYNDWYDKIAQCSTLHDFEHQLELCINEWVTRTNDKPEAQRPPRQGHRRRNQNRSVRRSKKSDLLAKSRIQRLYARYPKRATREILNEKSANYTGTLDEATQFLKNTYERPLPSMRDLEAAGRLFDDCEWQAIGADIENCLNSPPTAAEITSRLKNAVNTAPGKDRLEYIHIKSLDGNGKLLEAIFKKVWELGIPRQWKTSRTVPIFKKGCTENYENFRPISLLPTVYKVFSGILASRITNTAIVSEWISAEQKGFIPGVRGVQEHTFILQAAIDEAKRKNDNLIITWLDLANAFGSIPHAILDTLFDKLPFPARLKALLTDIYEGNTLEFAVNEDSVPVHSTAGVRQGDPLSAIVFNLAAEPIIRAAKLRNKGFEMFNSTLHGTAFADDLAVISDTPENQQPILRDIERAARTLGLRFNADKCASLVLYRGKVQQDTNIFIQEQSIRTLSEGQQETYLGIPMGSKFLFRPPDDFIINTQKIEDSGLAPWQQLEVMRSALIPSMAHSMASGKIEITKLYNLNTRCRDFMRKVANVPMAANTAFFYADRKIGGLGLSSLEDEAKIWTVATAVQLLGSNDPVIKNTAAAQLEAQIQSSMGKYLPPIIPFNEYLSGSMECSLHTIRHGAGRRTLWSRARDAARSLKGVRIDVTSGENPSITADDVSIRPATIIRDLRLAIRKRWTERLLNSAEGKSAQCLNLAGGKSKEVIAMMSCRTKLNFQDWHYIHQARLGLLPTRACKGSKITNQNCRFGCSKPETTMHVLNNCQHSLRAATSRHDEIQEELVKILRQVGHPPSINEAMDGSLLRPDLVTNINGEMIIIDVTVPYETPANFERAAKEKKDKYEALGGTVLPFVVGSLGAWSQSNDIIREVHKIPTRKWASLRRKVSLIAIKNSTNMIQRHLNGDWSMNDHDVANSQDLFQDPPLSPSSPPGLSLE